MEDDKTDNDSSLYAMHDKVSIALSKKKSITLFCVKELTPLDMMDLWNGKTDPTGNKLWMGALFFVEVMSKYIPVFSTLDDNDSPRNTTVDELVQNEKKLTASSLMKMRKELFGQKRVLELGAGTGASGISLMTGAMEADEYIPEFITFTDFDPNVLDLCRKNCAVNLKGSSNDEEKNENDRYAVCSLTWVTNSAEFESCVDRDHLLKKQSYDTVIATDVLYDIASVTPLLQTAGTFLGSKGHFVLSHVPRASVDYESAIADSETLEKIIIREAENHGLFQLSSEQKSLTSGFDSILRPFDMIRIFETDNTMPCRKTMYQLKEMDEVGASILIFSKH